MDHADVVNWVERARCGDARAWAPLVDEFLRTVVGAAYAQCRDWELAHDVAQETFAIAIERVRELREPAAFPGWLLAIVRSRLSRARRSAREGDVSARPPAAATSEPPDVAVARAAQAQGLRRAVEGLPEGQRLPVVLHYYAGLSVAEIGALLGLPVSTVKRRMRVARARLREEEKLMSEEALRSELRPQATTTTRTAIQWFCAVRAGDRARVAALLDAEPELVHARESFSERERRGHRLALAAGGTALLRAIERGDDALVGLLLERGADPNAPCDCAGGEPPLWTAVVHRRANIAALLLARGADPNASAFAGATPLWVARVRGYDELADLLVAHGADRALAEGPEAPRGSPACEAQPRTTGEAWWTGIRALDLWSPLPREGLVRWTPQPGVGSSVLLGELAWRAGEGQRVTWAGFAPLPMDRGDFVHLLAELGVAERVALRVAPHDAPRVHQVEAFEAALREAGDGLLVVFEAEGFTTELEMRLPELAARRGLTLVVAPLGATPPSPAGSLYRASVAFDRGRAARGQWPAVGAEGSWSRAVLPELAPLTTRARRALALGGPTAAALHVWLCQPFFSTEPFIRGRGQTTSPTDFARELGALLAADRVPTAAAPSV